MKKPFLVHGGWCVAAISSFVLGAQFFPADDQASVGTGQPRDSKKSTRILGREGNESGTSSGLAPTSGGHPELQGSTTMANSAILSEEDIASLGEQFRKAGSPIDRRLAFSRLLEGLTEENALHVRKQIEHVSHRSDEYREFHYAWGAVGGTKAIMFGAETPGPDMSPALSGWASTDPHGAIKWLETLDFNDPAFNNLLKERRIPPEELRNHLMSGLVQGLADTDPNTALNYVFNSTEGGKVPEQFLTIVMNNVLRGGATEEAAEWSEGLPEGALRNSAMGRVAGNLANEDPEGAAKWVTNFADREEGSRMIPEVVARWSRRDPEATVQWLDDLPASEGRARGLSSAFHSWVARNPEGAGDFINQMPPSPERDSAISGFATRLVQENPASGVQWASSISDPAARERAMISTGQVYFRHNPEGARAWLASSGLPPESQLQITSPQPRGD